MAKKPTTQTGSKLDKLGGNPLPRLGPGLFDLDPRAGESANRAEQALLPFLRDLDAPTIEKAKAELLEASRFYWADQDYDNEPTIGSIKEELKTFVSRSANFSKAIREVSAGGQHVINTIHARKSGGRPQVPILRSIDAELQSLSDACADIIADHYKGRTAVAVKSCCARLWKLRESITGRPFVGTISTATRAKWTDGAAPLREFGAPDAHFVHLAMTAIDGTVDIATVHTKLRELSQARSAARVYEAAQAETENK